MKGRINFRQDRYEQLNLASLPDYADILSELKSELARVTATFEHPFPADPHPVQRGEQFEARVRNTQKESATSLQAGTVFGNRYW